MAEKKEYYVRVHGVRIPVTHEVYQACHSTKRYIKTQYERDRRNMLVSYDGMDTDEMLGVDTVPDRESPSVEEAAITGVMAEKLHQCFKQLPLQEQALLHALYFCGHSERKLAKLSGIPRMTIHDRKKASLRKLKKLMEK